MGRVEKLPSPSDKGAPVSRHRQRTGRTCSALGRKGRETVDPLASVARAEDAGASSCGMWANVNLKGRQRALENNCEISEWLLALQTRQRVRNLGVCWDFLIYWDVTA